MIVKALLLFILLTLVGSEASDEVWCNRETFRPALDHTCAIDNYFHHVHCWGGLSQFQFNPPADVEFVKLSGIHQVGCGLSKDGRVYLWGIDHSNVITKTPKDDGFIDVSCGVHHACGIKEDNTVTCWGLGNDNRLNVPANLKLQQIECANEHTCGLTLTNTIECWGLASENRLAHPDGEFLSIRCGHGHCYAIKKEDKKLVRWGVNGHGQINTPDGWDTPKQFDLGYHYTCVINQDNKLKCWGHDTNSVVSTANSKSENEYKDVKCGYSHICVLTMEDKWECWGENAEINRMPLYYDWINIDDCGRKVVEVDYRENTFASGHENSCALDNSNHVICWGAGQMNIAPPTMKMKTIVSSQHNTYCGLTMDNGVKCWGSGDHGGVTSGVPTRTDLIAVTAGHDYACATTQDYLIVCWGHHGDGREYIPLNRFYKIVENAMYTTCGITFSGKVECWGYNGHGILNYPVDNTKIWTEIHCNYGCCALDQDRSLACWGYNSHGEVSNAPTSLKNIKQLAAGLHYFCIIKEDDSIQCWGRNSHGEASPPAGNNWLALGDMGIYVSCAMNKEYEIVCWGQNNKGELSVPSGHNWLPPGDIEAPTKTWLDVGEGTCPEVHQTGRQKSEFTTARQCRDRCFSTYSETYFTLTTQDDGTILCTCFSDCDTLTPEANVFAYEVLSEHVGEELQNEHQLMVDYRLRFGKGLEKTSYLEDKLTTMNNDLIETTKNLKDMTAQKRMYEERFKHIKENEPLSGKAEAAYPDPIYESSVGVSNFMSPSSSTVFNWLSLVLALGVGTCLGVGLSTRKKMRDELESLL